MEAETLSRPGVPDKDAPIDGLTTSSSIKINYSHFYKLNFAIC
jgi:hypothetical protein